MVGFGASTESMSASNDDGPVGLAILLIRSKENFTSEAVKSCPLANLSPFFNLTVNSLPSALNDPSSAAISGLTLPLPFGVENRYGNTCV